MSNGPTIKVSADLSGFKKEMETLEKSVGKVIDRLNSGEVGIDTSEAEKHLVDLADAVNKVRKAVTETAAKGDLSDLGAKAAADAMERAVGVAKTLEQAVKKTGGPSGGMAEMAKQARQAEEAMRRAARAQEVLAREGIQLTQRQAREAKKSYDELRSSGARGTGRLKDYEFSDWVDGGWRNYSLNERESQRHRAEVLKRLGINAPGGAGGAGRFASLAGLGRSFAGGVAGAVGGMLGGGGGGLWAAAGGGMGVGIGAGAGMLLGGPAGAAIGAIAGQLFSSFGASMDRMISQAGEEGGIYSDLRKTLGATTTDFDSLRGQVRHFTEGLGVVYNESARLAAEFARTASLQSGDGIGREVGTAIGLSRSFGASPEAMVRFLAEMRHTGASGGDRDSRRLALMIAEAVNSGGMGARIAEVLQTIQSYAALQARSSLSSPDVGAFASFMSSMTGLNLPGLNGDPGAASAAMMAADSAMRRSGAFGEASKNFSLGLWQRMMPGFNAFDLDFVNEQGAFGSVGKAFGRGSAAYQFAAGRGDRGKMAAYDRMTAMAGDRSVMAAQMQALEQYYGGDSDELRMAIQSHFGVGASQATALYSAYKSDRGLGGLESALRGAGVSLGAMNPRQVASLASLVGADGAGLAAQASKLSGLNLPKEERDQLEAAKGSEEELRKVVLRLTALHDTSSDQGDQMRRVQADMNNALQKLATELIPLTMWIKDGVLELVKALPGTTELEKRHESEKAGLKADSTRAKELDAGIELLRQQIDGFVANAKPDSPADSERKKRTLNSMQESRRRALLDGNPALAASMDKGIEQMRLDIAQGSEDGKDKLIAEHDAMVKERNKIDSVPAALSPYEALDADGSAGAGGSAMSGDKAEFLAATRDAAQAAADRINAETSSKVTAEMIQAQWALETGWGKRMLPGTNNLGNIKAGRGWHGKTKDFSVHEYVGGKRVMSNESFRVYDSMQEAGADYGALLARRYMSGNPAANSAEFAARMTQGGYATDPNYAAKLLSVMDSIPPGQDARVPAAGLAMGAAPQQVDVRVHLDGSIPITDANGMPTGREVALSSHVSQPKAFGAR